MWVVRTKRLRCALLALTAAVGAVACATTQSKTPAEVQADKQTAARVEAALNADPQIFARHIDVYADNGVVHLRGYVWDERDFREAKRVAASTPGVTQVVSEMELQRGGRNGSR
jgi:osmotically-inducible protein OsmY